MSNQFYQKLYHGWSGGLAWETLPQWDEERKAYISRALLINNDIPKLLKCLQKANRLPHPFDLPTLKKDTISQAFGMIYERASYNVKDCVDYEPVAYFGKAMKAFSWAGPIEPELFWKFTYRALMARSIFFETQPGAAWAPRHDMIKYLDEFKDAFYQEYPQVFDDEHLHLPPSEQDPKKVEEIMKRFNDAARVNALYFPVQLTHADYDGDKTDKIWVVKEGKKSTYDYVLQNKSRSAADMRERQVRGLKQGWLREDGSANPWYDQSDEGDEQSDEVCDEADDEEQTRIQQLEYELEYDIYIGSQWQNTEEDTQLVEDMSKLEVSHRVRSPEPDTEMTG
ncbi:hypothetical protein PG985_010529 [Apiospora marii]|uniref:Uncharacterized protein n=1 Tax=Apiospora marii TaxID=335849 RepID=A0ABR1T2P2_9PEZI